MVAIPVEPADQEDKPIKRGDLITDGAAVELPQPSAVPAATYPPALASSGRYANIVVRALVDEHGAVIEANIKSASVDDGSPSTEFRKEALVAASRARFEPAKKNGIPGKMWAELTYEFGTRQ